MTKKRIRIRHGRLDTTLVAPHQCPSCGTLCDAVSGAGEDAGQPLVPSVGDVVICAYCHAIQMMTVEGMRLATPEECKDLPPLALEFLSLHQQVH
jgi:hypothetical protein